MIRDTAKLKENIISIIKIRGPSLPVHIGKQTDQSILFASAFLSELVSDKTLKVSDMKVGGSPLYLIPGQESQLENFSQHLKNKEKDAFILLKEKKFLVDKDQEPAIRVALRMIKDFAIPFQKNGEIYWRYFTIPLTEFKETTNIVSTTIEKPSQPTIQEKQEDNPQEKSQEKALDIFDEKEAKPKVTIKKIMIKKPIKRKPSQKANEKFFDKIKEFLTKKMIEISGIEGFSKGEFYLRIRENEEEKLLVAYNKKRITESDIIKAHKKAKELNLPYAILSLGEPAKKIQSFIDAIKDLHRLDKIE